MLTVRGKPNLFKRTSWSSAVFSPIIFSLTIILFTLPRVSTAVSPRIGVIYPNMRPPYQNVFNNIIQGVEEITGESANLYDIENGYDSVDLLNDLQNDHIETVITLGQRALKLAMRIPKRFDVLAGAVYISPNTNENLVSGISFDVDPEIIFSRLKKLAPGVNKVSVVYNPAQSDWLIERAKNLAPNYGLTFVALSAYNLRTTATLYRDIAQHADSNQSMWLLQDQANLDQSVILPMILKLAWDKQFVVISSNPAHVKKGALFSLYPDNVALGRRLASMAVRRFQEGVRTHEILPARELLIAVNIRTAKRLNLDFSIAQQREFDLVFPSE